VQVRLALIERDGCSVVCSQECGHRDGCKTDEILALRRRERELLHGTPPREFDWLPPVVVDATMHTLHGVNAWKFHRGFVSNLRLSWEDWLTHYTTLLDACPIRHAKDGLVRLTTWPDFEIYDLGDRLRLHGCEAIHTIPFTAAPYGAGRATIVGKLLAAEFAGVHFELPATATGEGARAAAFAL
jgi:hypothetical protein